MALQSVPKNISEENWGAYLIIYSPSIDHPNRKKIFEIKQAEKRIVYNDS